MHNTQSTLRTETYLREDIRSLLSALSYTNCAYPPSHDAGGSERYREGFDAAIQAVAKAFDVSLPHAREWTDDARSATIEIEPNPAWISARKQ